MAGSSSWGQAGEGLRGLGGEPEPGEAEAWGQRQGHLTQPAERLQDIPLQGHLKLSQDAGQLVLDGAAHLQGLPVDTLPMGPGFRRPLPHLETLSGLPHSPSLPAPPGSELMSPRPGLSH
jgi:hypothetical protein